MAYTTINKGSNYFNTKLYTGDNTNNRQILLDFSPDFTWIKGRNVGYSHILFDRVRTNANYLITNATSAETDGSSVLGWTNTGCTTNSFTIDKGSNGSINNSGDTYVAWNWLAGGTGVSNTQGSIASTVSANTTSGFSIVSYTGTGSGATVGHGLGVAPKMVICKTRSTAGDWNSWHTSFSIQAKIALNTTEAIYNPGTGLYWNSTLPTSSVFSVGTSGNTNGSGITYIAYCFAEKKGFSKFGSYIGNGIGSGGGPFIYLGFKPAFFLLKESTGVDNWTLLDNRRLGYNVRNDMLFPNLSNAEYASDRIQLYSNGVKIVDDDGSINQSGQTYIYMAFAESPFVGSDGTPTTAR